jgi:hypothetical protein
MSTAFMAFENETDVLSVGGMSIENRLDRISIYGSLDITKDKSGLTDALVLKRVIDAAIDEMKRDKNLPDTIQTLKAEEASNPF